MASITDKDIAEAKSDAIASGAEVWVTDKDKARGRGRMRLRASPSGKCAFYFRYADSNGKQVPLKIGIYDEKGKGGLSLKEAREKADELSKLYQHGKRDLRAYLEHKVAEESIAEDVVGLSRPGGPLAWHIRSNHFPVDGREISRI